LVVLLISVLASYLFTHFSKRINVSSVVGLIVFGIILGSPLFEEILLGENKQVILALGDVALLVLMFLAGLEVSWCLMYEERKNAFYVAFFAALVPFFLGFSLFFILGFGLQVALVMGIAMSITSEATKARVLMEIGKMETKIGSLMMGAGILDDIFGFSMFSIIVYTFSEDFLARETILLTGAIMAFFAGILVHGTHGRRGRVIQMERVLIILVVPFFFIGMGIHFDYMSLVLDPLLLLLIIMAATAGKMVGTIITRPLTGLQMRQLYLVGWGMNSRGAVEIALALIAFRTGLLPVELYSGLVVMALVTTLIFPFFLRGMVKRDPDIMGPTVTTVCPPLLKWGKNKRIMIES
jgi:Kef-type K+ transport system membrane component KefB